MEGLAGLMGTDEKEVRGIAPVLISSAITAPLAFIAIALLGGATLGECAAGLIAWTCWLTAYYVIFFHIPRKYRTPSRSAVGIRAIEPEYNEAYYKVILYSPVILSSLILVSVILYNRMTGLVLLAVFLSVSVAPISFGRNAPRP